MLMRKLLLLIRLLVIAAGAQKTVHVRTYSRKDGTVVQAHTRSAAGAKAASSPTAPAKPKAVAKAKPAAPVIVPRTSAGRIARSATAKRQFEASHLCPATSSATGPCPGYVIDHRVPLACGGVDAPSNMQWQTTAAAKEKDRWERAGCATTR
jgi:hypothetical protein